MERKGRHEHKIHINAADYMGLVAGLRHLAILDSNALEDGKYRIRSLYFDNYQDKAVFEKFSGISRREKFRIRFYNNNPSFIRLEKKSKCNRLCYKENMVLTKGECEKILAGDYAFLMEKENALCAELYTKLYYEQLRPRTIVDYYREAYIYPPGNVRITLDSNIRMSHNVDGLFSGDLVTIPAAKATILEVKYDGFLPENIRQLIRLDNRFESEFSKYGVSRLV